MSNMRDENKNPSADSDQSTKKVPTVGKESIPDVLQRRRALHQEQEAEAAGKTERIPASTITPELQEDSRVETRVTPEQKQEAAGIPQPRVLNRAQQGRFRAQATRQSAEPEWTGMAGQTDLPEKETSVQSGSAQKLPVTPKPQDVQTPDNLDADFEALEEASRPKSVVPVVIIMIILVLALLIVALMMIPDDAEGFAGDVKRAVTSVLNPERQPASPAVIAASDFSGMPLQGAAPLEITFSLTTDKQAQQVRIVNESGEPMNAESRLMTDNADIRVWSLRLTLSEAYTGSVQAQVSGGESWQDTGCTQQLQITGEIISPTEQPTEAPTDVPVQPTEVPTDVPAQPAEAPTAVPEQPTELPTDVPAQPTEAPIIDDEPSATESPVPMAIITEQPTSEPVATLVLDITPTPLMPNAATPAPTEIPTVAAAVETDAPTEVPPAATEQPSAKATEPPVPLTAQAVEETLPEKLLAPAVIYNNAARKLDEYARDLREQINMPSADAYLNKNIGVLTFRGSSFRQNAANGNVKEGISSMSIRWQVSMGRIKSSGGDFYYGAGYQSQPAIVQWSSTVRPLTNIVEEKKNTSALKEVILPGMDGKIYFLDLADGQQTRAPINLGYPMRSAPCLHSLTFPVMSVGQYARKMASGTGKIGLRFYDLLTQKEIYRLDGLDTGNNRIYYQVGSFETSSLMDAAADTMISLGTNGMLYLTRLNTEFFKNDGTIKITPENVTMTSHGINQKNKYAAVESSMAAYQHYVWYADMEGILRCVDTDTLTPIWAVDTGDSVEAAVALRLDEAGQLWLYTANELNIRTKGNSAISCYNALTGECRWTQNVALKNSQSYTAGVKASPVIGRNQLEGLVYFTVSGVSCADHTAHGMLLAMSADTGEIVWQHELQSYAYSSPVAVYAPSGEGWIIQADAKGNLELINALTGDMLFTLKLDGPVESSPAVYGNTLVIATCAKNGSAIYGITLE